MAKHLSYVDCCTDPNIFGPWFGGNSWGTWRVIDKAIFGLPFDEGELAVFTSLTGRNEAPTEPCKEAWLIFGRRGGKDIKAASYVSYLATIGAEAYDWRSKLTRGERGVVQLLAVDRNQARVSFDYVQAFFEQPMLAKMVKRTTADSIELKNNLTIEITTNDKRQVRGRTVVCGIFDEVAHWRNEATANPDEDVYAAIQPSTLTIPNALLIGISSPYSRRGLLWRRYDDHWCKPGSVLVARAPTWVMNPTISREHELIARKYEEDPADASAEYGGEFRRDLEAYVSIDVVRSLIRSGVRERLSDRKIEYVGFCDPSGGSNDSMTLGVAHMEGITAILDLVREVRPPFSPEMCVAEFASVLRQYRVSSIRGDRYAAEWVVEQFRKHGVHYEHSEETKSEIYTNLLPMLNSGAVDLLDDNRLVAQLVGLERNTARGGKDSSDHVKHGHDDLINAAAGALVMCSRGPYISARQREKDRRTIAEARVRFARSIV